MTTSNRITIFVAAFLAIAVLLCHSPWTGYDTEIPAPYVSPLQIEASCPGYLRAYSSAEYSKERMETIDKIAECAQQVQGNSVPLKITAWSTSAPLVNWFGSLVNSAIVLLAIALLTALWLFLNKQATQPTSTQ